MPSWGKKSTWRGGLVVQFNKAQTLFWEYAQDMRDKLNTDIWQSLTTFEG